MEVEMKIRGLMVDPSTNMPVVILKDPKSEAVLPIWVGLYEANAIQLEVEKATTARPLTARLMKKSLSGDLRIIADDLNTACGSEITVANRMPPRLWAVTSARKPTAGRCGRSTSSCMKVAHTTSRQ